MATHEATVEGVGVGVSDEGGRGNPVVLLQAREELLPIFVSADQAQSMQHALDGTPFERPLTHDLFVDMVAEFGAAIDRIRIDDLADGTFYAKIDTEQYHGGERKDMVFDARPSDGIALALRVDCPILVSDEVLDEAGRDPDELGLADEERERDPPGGPGSGPGPGPGFGTEDDDPRFGEDDDDPDVLGDDDPF
ncbi:bifunctional nuclease family protein [Halobacteriales archaeon QS_5_68_33]|nr:MAG: bifunctional nuclease family protein [Halobacteriales archaeon QS_5_68_33]